MTDARPLRTLLTQVNSDTFTALNGSDRSRWLTHAVERDDIDATDFYQRHVHGIVAHADPAIISQARTTLRNALQRIEDDDTSTVIDQKQAHNTKLAGALTALAEVSDDPIADIDNLPGDVRQLILSALLRNQDIADLIDTWARRSNDPAVTATALEALHQHDTISAAEADAAGPLIAAYVDASGASFRAIHILDSHPELAAATGPHTNNPHVTAVAAKHTGHPIGDTVIHALADVANQQPDHILTIAEQLPEADRARYGALVDRDLVLANEPWFQDATTLRSLYSRDEVAAVHANAQSDDPIALADATAYAGIIEGVAEALIANPAIAVDDAVQLTRRIRDRHETVELLQLRPHDPAWPSRLAAARPETLAAVTDADAVFKDVLGHDPAFVNNTRVKHCLEYLSDDGLAELPWSTATRLARTSPALHALCITTYLMYPDVIGLVADNFTGTISELQALADATR